MHVLSYIIQMLEVKYSELLRVASLRKGLKYTQVEVGGKAMIR